MRQFFLRFQLLFVSVIVLATFVMLMGILMRYNKRWDLTREKIYSLSDRTVELLSEMDEGKVEILLFYPRHDAGREELEIFLKEAQIQHGNLSYDFFDPESRPQLAKQWKVREIYTVIIRYQERQERIIQPDEEVFATALLKLAQPKEIPICFTSGHGEGRISREGEKGLSFLGQSLGLDNYPVHEVLIGVDQVPDFCQVLIVAGPQKEWKLDKLKIVQAYFEAGGNVLFLIDPMDQGTGVAFQEFLKGFGIRIGADVVVDKMSRMVGGDFLVPFVNRYSQEHLAMVGFTQPTFFPVARTVTVSSQEDKSLKKSGLAFSGSNSWAETNLEQLEKGEAAFDARSDMPGPLPLAVAIEGDPVEEKGKRVGRMIIVGDSDFITNAYLGLSGNRRFALRLIHWLVKDERRVSLEDHYPQFQPLVLNEKQKSVLVSTTLAGPPVFFLLVGSIAVVLRKGKK